jgi:CRISPR-associated protein Cas8a1/Csx13
MFALIGCLSLPAARGGSGVLVIPVPEDLIAFAAIRPLLTPKKVSEVHVTGVGDAVLGMNLALRLAEVGERRRGISDALGLLLRMLPWAKQQKSRAWTLEAGVITDDRLDAYEQVIQELPSRIRETDGDDDDGESEGFFVATSAFRGFVTDNLAQGRPWYSGFSTADTGGKRPRYIHYFRDRDGGLGALYPEEKKGIIVMAEYLERAERLLVESVHIALRGRFAQIAEESSDTPATMRNRFKNERERLRLAFAGAKTPDQIRGALADLWSRGGTNRELQASWRDVLPLLKPECWQVARDLALIALASYQSASQLGEGGDDENQPAGGGGGSSR